MGVAGPTDPVFIIGAQRSGTTWLGKIFDSHPDVIYRHEPDDNLRAPDHLNEAEARDLVAKWCANRGVRIATKPPLFRKSWQSLPAYAIRGLLGHAMIGLARLPGGREAARRWEVPDMGDTSRARFVLKTVLWCEGVGVAARALPDSRTIVIIRRPRGQVHSVLRGARQGRFELRGGGNLPIHQTRAMQHAALYGIDATAFEALPDAAKCAWDWVAFNEIVEAAVRGLSNVRTVLYEDLTSQPEQVVRDLFSFSGLSWDQQTADFLRTSANAESDSGYYNVVKNASQTAQRWRSEMSEEDSRAVVAVARQSSLARYWPDLLTDPA